MIYRERERDTNTTLMDESLLIDEIRSLSQIYSIELETLHWYCFNYFKLFYFYNQSNKCFKYPLL